MAKRPSERRNRPRGVVLGVVLLVPAVAAAAAAPDPGALLDQAVATAEAALRRGDTQAAQERYRAAQVEGWLLLGTLARIEGRLAEAEEAFRKGAGLQDGRASRSLAAVHLQRGDAGAAERVLAPLAEADPGDTATRRLLAQALVARGQPEKAVAVLEKARAVSPGDMELAFALADAHLRAREVDAAAALLARITRERPIPQTRVLVGRTYGGFGHFDRARAELRAALEQDPRVRRAHYHLGMLALEEKGRAGLEEALSEFGAELRLDPRDPLANLEWGVGLVESQRPEEALAALEIAARSEPLQSRTLFYLGRSQLAHDRPAEAAASLKRALELAGAQGANLQALRAIHMHLGQALKKGGAPEAARHFEEAARLSAAEADATRRQLARFMADDGDSRVAAVAALPLLEASPLAEVPAAERAGLESRTAATLARVHLNLGILETRRERFAEAAAMFEQAAELDPDLPQVQSSLGVAYFNAQRFEEATAPLSRALEARPEDAALRRMLALAWLNAQAYAKAAELLQDDPERAEDPSLQFAYGLALVKSGRAAEAEPVFSSLLRRHGDSAEVMVLLGQAHAQQGSFEAATESLRRALELNPAVAGAHAALGVIHLRRGRMAEAEEALRAELEAHPTDLESQKNLAIVLEALQRPGEASSLLRRLLESKPDLPDASYLLGKLLLAQGDAAEAVRHLEAAAQASPADPNVRYQLGRAYQKLGRAREAQEEFETFRRLKKGGD